MSYSSDAHSPLLQQSQVFARHFAHIREQRYLSKVKAAQALSGGGSEVPTAGGAAKVTEPIAPARSTFSATAPAAAAAAPTAAAPDTRKRTPADFVLMKKIGTGAYSTVHLAEEKSTKSRFASK
jgi:hypothetical protein